jgi:hypothetical protein
VITSSRAGHLRDALCRAREVVGFDSTAEGDEAFRQLVLARIIESASEQDSLRVLGRPGLIRRHVPGDRGPPVYSGLKPLCSPARDQQVGRRPNWLVDQVVS